MAGVLINENKDDDMLFPGKIAIITDPPAINKDDFHSADRLIEKYGDDKIVHTTWPEVFMAEQDKVIDIVTDLAKDRDVKVLIISQAIQGTNTAIDELKKTRGDIFIACSTVQESSYDASRRANLLFNYNHMGMGSAMVKQAKKQGAKVFVHYSFPRHMVQRILSNRLEMIKGTCAAEGIKFVYATAPDSAGEAGLTSAHQFILEDVPKLVAKYGEDTAFFSTCCSHQVSLIKAVVDSHAIYPQPCCPSPYHGFPEALGIKTDNGKDDLNYVIGEACRIAAEKNMTDRLSTWPVSASMMFTNAGAEYAIKWIRDEVPKTGIDETVLREGMAAFVNEAIGEAASVYINSYSEGGQTYNNYKLVLMSYLDF